MEVSSDITAWIAIEKKIIINSSLPALLFSAPGLPANKKLYNRIILNRFKIWQQIRKTVDCQTPPSMLQSHAQFLPSLSGATFDSWRQKGIVTIKCLYNNSSLHSPN